jgi:DNA polymerase III subunit delta'
MPFSKLIGNELAKTALQRMVDQKSVPNTLLFYGPDGVGKSLFAVAFAELLMGKAQAHKLATQNHPDLHIYLPEGKSAIHTMENMRKLIDEVALPPYEAPVKVFIIHDAHQMLTYSSHALLKTFEEPSFHSYFILLTNALDIMLPTMVSRCRKVPFFPIPQSQIATLIQNEWKKTSEEARRIAFLSHGSLAKAKVLADHSHLAPRKILLEILTLRMPDDYPQFLKLAAELEESCVTENVEEKEEEPNISSLQFQTDAIFEEIVAWYRDLQLLKEGIAPEYLYHLNCMDNLRLALQQPFPPLEVVIEKVAKARLALQRNIRLRTVLEHFFLSQFSH